MLNPRSGAGRQSPPGDGDSAGQRSANARYDAEAVVAAFSQRLREAVDLETVHRELVAAVIGAVQPRHTSHLDQTPRLDWLPGTDPIREGGHLSHSHACITSPSRSTASARAKVRRSRPLSATRASNSTSGCSRPGGGTSWSASLAAAAALTTPSRGGSFRGSARRSWVRTSSALPDGTRIRSGRGGGGP